MTSRLISISQLKCASVHILATGVDVDVDYNNDDDYNSDDDYNRTLVAAPGLMIYAV